ncbi:PadR family transcriptional regulator [Paenibacillus sp.]|uniref:PadR family transcriptional regulator n=1 Tax=Paenibacillus sp. TaxID=58172 RepID=UPI00281273AF|nr:PadR family transcriptional regulator [Paenibacillus sp.]
MSIQYAILGILSYRSMSGYDLKKIMQESPIFPWSGNNNQIYKSLVELLEAGLLTHEVVHQESSPSKKIYSISDAGSEALERWANSRPEPPECKKLFLAQLAWADVLSEEELDGLIGRYEEEVESRLRLHEEQIRRASFAPARTARESVLWDMINENVLDFYRNEKAWIRKWRAKLADVTK